MPILPTYESRADLATDRGGVPTVRPDAGQLAIADAVDNVSAAGQNIFLRIQQRQEEKTTQKSAVGLRQLDQDLKQLYESDLENIEADGSGFFEGFQTNAQKLIDGYYGSLSPDMQDRFRDRLNLVTDDWLNTAARTEHEQGNEYATSNLTDTLNSRLVSLQTNPDALDAVREAGFRDIEEIGATLSPAAREAQKRAFYVNTWLTSEDARIATDASYRARYVSPEAGYYAAIRSAESGGNDGAKNPGSTATGRYQFLEGTWAGLVERYPGAGLTKDGRTDPQQQEIAIRLFTAENRNVLEEAGLQANYGNLYAAHFLGAGDAVKVLKSDDTSTLTGLLSSDVLNANPQLKSMTVGEFKAWTASKASGIDVPEGTTPQQMETLRSAATRYQATDQKTRKEAYDLAIVSGTLTDPNAFLNDPVLDNGDKATLLRAFETENGDRALIQSILSGAKVNSFDADQRRAADKAYDSLIQGGTEEEIAVTSQDFVEQTGYIPTPLRNELRSAVASNQPNDVAAGLETAKYYESVAPRHFSNFEGHEGIQKDLDLYNAKRRLGYSAEEAGQFIIDGRDPEKRTTRKAILESADAEKAIEGITANAVGDIFDKGIWDAQPSLGETPEAEAIMTAAYKTMFEDALVDARGDVDAAKLVANDRYMKLYNVSAMSTNGENVVIKNPVEVSYPPVDGSHDYVRNQALEVLLQQPVSGDATDLANAIIAGKVKPIEADDIYLQPYQGTEEARRAGSPYPPYQVLFKMNGRMQMLDKPFFAIPEEAAKTPDLSGSRSTFERNVARETERNRLLETGKTGGTVFDEMNAAAEEVRRFEGTAYGASETTAEREQRALEERAFREGRKAYESTQGADWQKARAEADAIERILNEGK